MPVFEPEEIQLNIEPHPEDFVETLHPALDMIRMIGSKNVKFLHCAPHTFYFGADMAKMIGDAAPMLAHVHVADTNNHMASSGLRYICNPPGAQVTVHQHMDIGQGEVGFDGIMTAHMFAWEERADQFGRFLREEMQRYVDKFWAKPKGYATS